MPVKNVALDARLSPPVLRARLAAGPDGRQRLLAPAVGLFRGAPDPGAIVGPDQPIGALEILGVVHHVLAPAGAGGLVIAAEGATRGLAPARRPVGFDDLLLTLDPSATRGEFAQGAAGPAAAVSASGAAVLRAPTSGRFYVRSGPGKPAFVSVGAVLEQGQTVGLIEVMKTFSRVLYGGDELPSRARVVRLCQTDESDVAQGDPLIEVEPADAAGDPKYETPPG
jgi:acetyl-CoA carboxylase biotin carboxyl carrier protein